jgi:hypothetical protein
VTSDNGARLRVAALIFVMVNAVVFGVGLKRFSPGLNRGIPKRLAVMESFVH